MLIANDILYQRRLEYLNETVESVTVFSADVFMKEFSWELIKDSELYKRNDIIRQYIDCGKGLLGSLSKKISMGQFAFHMTMLAGNIGFGTANVYDRYQEMKVLVDIVEAIVEANSKIVVSSGYLSENTINKIRVKCDYYKMLIVTHARGEYLTYQLLVKDSKLLSYFLNIFDAFKEPSQTTKGWYDSQIDVMTRKFRAINNIFMLQDNNEGMELEEENKKEIILETFTEQLGQSYSYVDTNKKLFYDMAFGDDGKVFFGIWNESRTSASYEDFSFQIENGVETYLLKGNRGEDVYELHIIPIDKKRLEVTLHGRDNKDFDLEKVFFVYDLNAEYGEYVY